MRFWAGMVGSCALAVTLRRLSRDVPRGERGGTSGLARQGLPDRAVRQKRSSCMAGRGLDLQRRLVNFFATT